MRCRITYNELAACALIFQAYMYLLNCILRKNTSQPQHLLALDTSPTTQLL